MKTLVKALPYYIFVSGQQIFLTVQSWMVLKYMP